MTGRHLPKLLAKQRARSMSDRRLLVRLTDLSAESRQRCTYDTRATDFWWRVRRHHTWVGQNQNLRASSTFFTTRRLQIRGQGTPLSISSKLFTGASIRSGSFLLYLETGRRHLPLVLTWICLQVGFKACKSEWSLTVSDNPGCALCRRRGLGLNLKRPCTTCVSRRAVAQASPVTSEHTWRISANCLTAEFLQVRIPC